MKAPRQCWEIFISDPIPFHPTLPVPDQSRILTLTNDLAELSRVADFVSGFCSDTPATPGDLSALQLAMEEVITNVIMHGYGEGGGQSLTLAMVLPVPDRIKATVTDRARPFNPLLNPDVDTSLPLEERPIGGLGIHLVKKLMDSCHYEWWQDQNRFTLERKLGRDVDAVALMRIATSKRPLSAILSVSGRLDGLSGPELERQFRALCDSDIRNIVFDLSSLDYVSSAGLRVFLLAAKTLRAEGGSTGFAGLTPTVREVFEVSGLIGPLDVRESVSSF